VNAAGLTSGSVVWGGLAGSGCYSYTPSGGWSEVSGYDLSLQAWQGGPFTVLRGLAAAYAYPGGPGPAERTFETDDSRRYTVVVPRVDGTYLISPSSRSAQATATQVEMDLRIVAEVGDQELATT